MMMEMIMKQTVSRKVQKKEAVSDFQNLSFIKRGYVQTLSCKNEFYLHEHKKSFSSIAWHLVSPWNRGLAQIRNGVLAIETKARAPKRKTRSEIWQRFIASSRTQSRALKLQIVLFLETFPCVVVASFRRTLLICPIGVGELSQKVFSFWGGGGGGHI